MPGSDLTLAKHSLVASVQRAISASQVAFVPCDGRQMGCWRHFFVEDTVRVLEEFHCGTLPAFQIFEVSKRKKITRIGYGVGITGLSDSCLWRRLCCIQPSKFALPLTCPVAHCRTLVHTVSPLPPLLATARFLGAAVHGRILVLITLGWHLGQASDFLAETSSISELPQWE